MTDHGNHAPAAASAEQFCQFWSAHVDALDRHLSTKIWAAAAGAVVLATYPVARIAIPAVLHAMMLHAYVPRALWNVLKLI